MSKKNSRDVRRTSKTISLTQIVGVNKPAMLVSVASEQRKLVSNLMFYGSYTNDQIERFVQHFDDLATLSPEQLDTYLNKASEIQL
jgi:hypothetical protein